MVDRTQRVPLTDKQRRHIARLLMGSTEKALAKAAGTTHTTLSIGLQADAFVPTLLERLMALTPDQVEKRKPRPKPRLSQNPFPYAPKPKTVSQP